MAIDTQNKRRYAAGTELPWMEIDLVPSGTVSNDDRENNGGGYIGFAYAPSVPEKFFPTRRSFIRGRTGI
jgi:hypothetical protein